ncbi:MAG: DUF2171 domain-containing protein [Alphaproteobacteria bacterium]|nr:DUF2171 domain-containing protein [Alphaproteobacteria bacterium]
MTGRRDNDYGRGGSGRGSFGGGWGNQRGESWNRERPGERGWYGAEAPERSYGGERHYARGEREGWFSDSRGGERGERYGGPGGGGGANYGSRYGGGEPELWGGSGYGGDSDRGRRFDRVDAGSTGTHGAHPMSAATGGGMGGAYGASSHGSGSSSRYAAAMRERGGGDDRSPGFGGDALRGGAGGPRGLHDPHYSEWRQRQIEDLDRDYDEYRREHQSKFESEFGSWRSKRQSQRQSLNRVAEHMEVVGADGSHVGTVDKVRGDRILLTKSDPSAGGIHHSVPCSWVESVDDKVTLNKSADDARAAWRSEERNQALFGDGSDGSDGSDGDGGAGGEGPRNLNRSFSGTYDESGSGDESRDG